MNTMKSFASDNYAGVLPEIIQALLAANTAHARAYGNDELTTEAKNLFKQIFQCEVDVFFVFNGTGANVLSIMATTQSYSSVLCSDVSHIVTDESTSSETVSGCRLVPIQSNEHGKLDPAAVEEKLGRVGDCHAAQPSLISLTQPTEYGTIYSIDELKQMSLLAKKHDLYLHIDGARFFNACASLNCELKDLTTDVGVDILSLGGTKIGLMFGEAVVVFNKTLAKHMIYKHKQCMQLFSKQRFIAAQFNEIFKNDLWRKAAVHANQMVQILGKKLLKYSAYIKITKPIQTNAVFAVMPKEWIDPLSEKFPFYVWNPIINEVRLMCSFDTTETDIEEFVSVIEKLYGLASGHL
ncbi:unnamed protein product [Didymodactylos carnosus]|uniref:Aromatic amino acid beta-eliminating lyase/threonine aldolase domain-containing protein n=1 Tax=Didymodactylos carnosus TaxID=1234261 RepID=A0A8S2GCX3_9BILA|nr:unnamed protein product [Didymodactylos carnosus]CAF3493152.1 unnamed protein product [Didymodactylos carnosus]